MQYIGSLEASEKHLTAKINKENQQTSEKFLQNCKILHDWCNDPAWKILQISTDYQRSKTWDISAKKPGCRLFFFPKDPIRWLRKKQIEHKLNSPDTFVLGDDDEKGADFLFVVVEHIHLFVVVIQVHELWKEAKISFS